MLAATRRAVLSASRRSAAIADNHLLLSNFVVGCSKDLERDQRAFSSSAGAQEKPRVKLSKEKLSAKLDKLERKREQRAVKAISAGAAVAEARVAKMERGIELQDKRSTAQELAEGLEPFSDDQLEGMYRGLIGATSEELGFPELEGPKALLLEDVEEVDLGTRDERLQGLAQRLEMLDVLEEELDEPGLDSGGLGDRLRLRRGGDDVLDSRVSSSAVEGEIVPISRARQLLGKLGESVSVEEEEKGMNLGVGVAVRSDWRDLVMECAELDDLEGVKLGMNLQRRSLPAADSELVTEVMALFGSQGNLRSALELARYVREKSIALSILTHHHLIESFLPSHPALAIQHLHALEAGGHIPLLISYTSVIRCLLRTDSPPHLVARGWDLYAHTRLVAHPVPDVALYATMIQACSRGPSPSPERAIDLFTEMTGDNRLAPSERAYNGVIRACSRQGSQENYFEALRYMRQMLDANVVPSRHTFHAIFEGAMRHGDLARARWMLVQMMGVGGDASPDANSLGLVFQAYANHVVPKGTKAGGAPVVLKTVDAPRVQVEEFNAPPAHERSTGTNAIIELLGESSLSFPGPLPQSSEELLAEAKNLMSQCVHPSSLPPLSESLTSNDLLPPFDSPVFPSLVPTTFLLNSYLNLLSSHADLDPAAHFFNTAYARLGVAKNRFTFEKMMTRCEVGRNKTVAMRIATETFKEWRAWDPTPEKVKTEQVEEEGGEKVEPEVPRSVLHAGKTGTNTSKMWASMIRSLARNFQVDESLALLQTFIALHPPSHLLAAAKLQRTAESLLPKQPSLVRLSSSAYPETTHSTPPDVPAHLLFDQIKILHLRLANIEDRKGIAVVKGICKAYEGALRTVGEFEEGKRRQPKYVPAVRPRAGMGQNEHKPRTAAERRTYA